MPSPWREIAEWDWVLAGENDADEMLHAVGSVDDPAAVEDAWGGPGVTVCGMRSEWLAIPGLFTRMAAQRCPECCTATGMRGGLQSPKNDDECRPIVERRIAALNGGDR